MKAIVWTKYGSPEGLQLREIERPTLEEGEVLVRVHAATVTMGDCEMRRLDFPFFLGVPLRLYNGLSRPKRVKVLGQEFVGVVVEAGEGVRRFQPNDRVFGALGITGGAYAEFLAIPAESSSMDGVMGLMPKNLTFEQAAVLPVGGLNALFFLSKVTINPNDTVLLNGAGGGIGTIALQIVKNQGARVTAVDHTDKLDLLRNLGADRVIDYTKSDFPHGDEKYDLIMDIIGKIPLKPSLKSLKPQGRLILANPNLNTLVKSGFRKLLGDQRIITGAASYRKEALEQLRSMVEQGEITPVLDRTFALNETAEAHRYVESGRKLGNVAIRVSEN